MTAWYDWGHVSWWWCFIGRILHVTHKEVTDARHAQGGYWCMSRTKKLFHYRKKHAASHANTEIKCFALHSTYRANFLHVIQLLKNKDEGFVGQNYITGGSNNTYVYVFICQQIHGKHPYVVGCKQNYGSCVCSLGYGAFFTKIKNFGKYLTDIRS